MKKLYTIIVLFICLTAQAQQVEWVKNIGSSANDQGLRCKVDNSGNFLFSGTFTDSIEFGDGIYLKGNGGIDAYLVKTNSSGTLIWAKVITGPRKGKSADARGIAIDANNNVYLAGTFTDTININGVQLYGQKDKAKDIYITKYSSNGTSVWQKVYLGPGSDIAEDIEISGSNLVMVGSYIYTLTIGSQTLQSSDAGVGNNYNPFVAVFDLDGTLKWVDKIDTQAGTCRACTVSADGKINLLVEAKGSPYLRTVGGTYAMALKQSNNTTTDDYLVQINPETGELVWSNQMGSDGTEMGYAITADASSNLYIGGMFQQTVNLNSTTAGTFKTSISKGGYDIFICKYNSLGVLQWAKFEGSTKNDGVYDIAVSSGGYVYLGCYFLDLTTVGDSSFTNAGITAYLAKYAPDGTFKWAQPVLGSAGTSYFNSLCITPSDSILLTGYFKGNGIFLDGSTQANPHDSTNVWFALISDKGNSAGIITARNSINLKVFPIPANDRITIMVDDNQRIQRVRIFNIIGNTVLDNTSGNSTIPVSNLGTGIYLLEVSTNKGRSVQRVVINR